jgi:hypothetical protein
MAESELDDHPPAASSLIPPRRGRFDADRLRGWRIVATLLFAYLGYAFSGYFFRADGFWRHLSVASLPSPFADLRVITTGWDCTRRGLDVLQHNPCDPWHRPMNYPRIWTWGEHLGLGAGATVPLAIALLAIFFASILWVSRTISVRCALLGSAVLLSPSVMLGVERANIDLIIFVMLLVYVCFVESGRAWQRRGAYGVLLAAIVAKLYPIAAAIRLLLRPRGDRRWRALVVVAVVAACYGVLTLHDLRLVSHGTPRDVTLAYGSRVLWAGLDVGLGDAPVVHFTAHRATAYGAVAVMLMLAAAAAAALLIGRRGASTPPGTTREQSAFVTGGAVFLLTFAIGNDYDYRLVFLLFAVPWLATLTASTGWWRALGIGAAVLLVAEVWLGAFTTQIFPVDELVDYALFLLMASLLFLYSLPVFVPRWSGRG